MQSLYNLGYVISLRDHVSGPLKAIEGRLDHLNESVKRTASWREAGENMAFLGAGMVAAGGAAAYALKSTIEPAMEMQAALAHVKTAMDDGIETGEHLRQVAEMADQVTARSVISDTELAQAYYLSRSNMLGHAASLEVVRNSTNLVEGTTKNAAEAQQEMAGTTRMLSTLVHQFGGTAEFWADKFAKLQTKYAFQGIGEVTEAMRYAMPVMQEYKINADQAVATLAGLSAAGLHGEQAGTAFREFVAKLGTGKKLHDFARSTRDGGLDVIASLGAINDRIKGMPAIEQARFLKGLGFGLRDITGVALLADKSKEMYAVAADTANAHGAAAGAAATRTAALDEQMVILHNNVEQVKESIGSAMIPALNGLMPRVIALAQSVKAFIDAHPGLTKWATGITAVAAALAIAIGTPLIFVGAVVMLAGYVPTLIGALGSLATGFYSAAAAGVTFLATNPVGWAILAAAAIGGAVYEIYQHWAGFKASIAGVWDWLMDHAIVFASAFTAIFPLLVGAVVAAAPVIVAGIGSIVASMANLAIMPAINTAIAAPAMLSAAWTTGSAAIASAATAIVGGLSTVWTAGAAFLATNPLGWAVLAAAALAVAAYAVYANWDKIGPWLKGQWSEIKAGAFAAAQWFRVAWAMIAADAASTWSGMTAWLAGAWAAIKGWSGRMYDAGAELLKSLAHGIASAATYPLRAAADVAAKIKDYFVGHSPPPIGPLHELRRIRIMETIAEYMQPGPVVAAARRAAAAVALTMPLVMNPAMSTASVPAPPVFTLPAVRPPLPLAMPASPLVGTMAAPAPLLPSMAAASASLPARPTAAPGRHVTITVNYAPVIHAGAGMDDDAFRKLLDDHKRDLLDTIKREQERAERTAY